MDTTLGTTTVGPQAAQNATTSASATTAAATMTGLSDLSRSCDALSLHVHAEPLQHMLRGLVAHVQQQDASIQRLNKALEQMHRAHTEELDVLRRDFEQRLRYTVENVATAMEAVRSETASICRKTLPDAQAIPALMERARRLEQTVETLREVNTQRSVEYVALSDRLDVAMQQQQHHHGSSTPRCVGGSRIGDGGGGLGVLDADVASSTNLVSHVEQLRRDMDDLLALFDIPNVFSSRSQRSLTSTSLHRAAHQTSQEQRVRFLHGLPCFHILWTELYRLQQKLVHPDGRSPTGVDGPPSFVASPLRFHDSSAMGHVEERTGTTPLRHATASSPSRQALRHGITPRAASAAAGGGGGAVVFVPQLGADVAAPSPGRGGGGGVVVVRLVRGGVLEESGVAVGDTIVDVNCMPLAGVFHLMDLMHDAAAAAADNGRGSSNGVCTLALIPAGRHNAMPISVRLAIGAKHQ